jgi:hypothetical protein
MQLMSFQGLMDMLLQSTVVKYCLVVVGRSFLTTTIIEVLPITTTNANSIQILVLIDVDSQSLQLSVLTIDSIRR